jgi:hypothetical protein
MITPRLADARATLLEFKRARNGQRIRTPQNATGENRKGCERLTGYVRELMAR